MKLLRTITSGRNVVAALMALVSAAGSLLLVSRLPAQRPTEPASSVDTLATSPSLVADTALLQRALRALEPPGDRDSMLAYSCFARSVVVTSEGRRTDTTTVTIRTNGIRVEIAGEHFSMVRDSMSVFTIIADRKTIHLTDGRAWSQAPGALPTRALRESFFASARQILRRTISDSTGRSLLEWSITPNPNVAERFNLSVLNVVVDPVGVVPVSIGASARLPDPFAEMSWTFSRVRRESAPESWQLPVFHEFLTVDGSLRDAWSSFSLVDSRQLPLASSK